MKVTLRQIEGFLAAAELLSFSRASQKLHITQSAFSQLIRETEASLNVRLFDRTTRSVILTKAGAELVTKMRNVIVAIESACQAAQSINQMDIGHVSLATLPSLAGGFVTQALGDLRRQHPGISISLHETDNSELLKMVIRGDVEFAICAQVPAVPEVTFELLYTEELVLVVPQGHPLSKRKKHRWSALKGMPLIIPALHTSTRKSITDAMEINGVELKPMFEVAGLTSSVSMVRAGLGVTVMPLTAMVEMNLDGVCTCQLIKPTVHRRIAICIRNDRTLSPAAMQIVQLMQARVGLATKAKLSKTSSLSKVPIQ